MKILSVDNVNNSMEELYSIYCTHFVEPKPELWKDIKALEEHYGIERLKYALVRAVNKNYSGSPPKEPYKFMRLLLRDWEEKGLEIEDLQDYTYAERKKKSRTIGKS